MGAGSRRGAEERDRGAKIEDGKGREREKEWDQREITVRVTTEMNRGRD